MKKKMLIAFLILIIVGITAHIFYLFSLTPNEVYPEDTYFKEEKNKTALIVVAHDDDAAVFAGTTSKLIEEGWQVNFLCFYPSHWRAEDNPTRKKEMEDIADIQGFKKIELIDFEMRNRLDTVEQPWMPMPYEAFPQNFATDSLRMFVFNAINQAKPSVIFMMDNEIGFYGHPEHVLVGKIVEEICELNKASSNNSVKKIYQGVWPSSQAENIMGHTHLYKSAKETYQKSGMPIPSVQVDIASYSQKKMDVFMAHASQHRNLKKLYPYFTYYPGWLYFRIFDKEYYNIIDVQ